MISSTLLYSNKSSKLSIFVKKHGIKVRFAILKAKNLSYDIDKGYVVRLPFKQPSKKSLNYKHLQVTDNITTSEEIINQFCVFIGIHAIISE